MNEAAYKPINVAILAYPNLCLFEFGCAMEVFGQHRPEFETQQYRVEVCGVHMEGPIGSPIKLGFNGLSIANAVSPDNLAEADLIIVPGWQGVDIEPCAELVRCLHSAFDAGARLASICSGVFLLAYAGFLKDQVATTHWQYVDAARSKFPDIQFDASVLYTENNRIFTSAGSAAGLDMCLHIVRSDFGQHVANAYARRLVLPPFREGGQAQFIQQPMPSLLDNRFAKLLEVLEGNLEQRFSVQKMASIVNLSERHFLRQFKAQFATTPSKWLTQLRLQKACELLETTEWPVKKIAHLCGLGSEETMRHHFRQNLKTSPLDYRLAFKSEP